MVRMSVFYPSSEGATLDHDYYRDRHVPLCVEHWKPAGVSIGRGVNGPYTAAVHITFASMEALGAAMASESTATIQADVANYTTITPVMQISEVVS